MKLIKFVASGLCVLLLCALCNQGLTYLLVDDTNSHTRLMMHDFYGQKENIDILFVGSSHSYSSIVPQIADELLGKNTFNASSSSLGMDGAFALIKEAVKFNDIEHIYLEAYYFLSLYEDYQDRTSEMTSVYYLSDYIKPSLNKVCYLLQASSPQYYGTSFIPARRNVDRLFDIDYISGLLDIKASHAYQNYSSELVNCEQYIYKNKGHIAFLQQVEDGTYNFTEHFTLDVQNISQDWQKSLCDILAFCQSRGIKLTIYSAPISTFRLMDLGNYDNYIVFIENLIEETVSGNNNVTYYDFNLLKDEYLSHDTTLYADNNHLNAEGAERFTELFCKLITRELSEAQLFHDTFEQKENSLPADIYGLITSQNRKECSILVEPVTNADWSQITYEVRKMSGDDVEVLQITDITKPITYGENESGTFEIFAYLNGALESRVAVDFG